MFRALSDGNWVDAWFSTMEVEHPVDFEMGNHFTATHPSSQFVNRAHAARPDAGRTRHRDEPRHPIRKNGVAPVRRTLDRPGLRALLNEYFGFDCRKSSASGSRRFQNGRDANARARHKHSWLSVRSRT